MRFALVAAIWLILVGGLALYTYQRERRLPPPIAEPTTREASMEAYTLEITPSFATAADPFALQGDTAASATLLVRLGERELFRSDKPLAAGATLSLHPVPGLVIGRNEIYLRAVPPRGEALDHALRVRLLQGGRVLLDQTLWGEKGANVSGSVPFTLTETGEAGHGD
ncbi:MAG: hypothetical protein A2075_21820 [Geobacteraceae bacterium GWC2_58_44]|nr:MAG: hypothetical protein A2075_21820 [Geobacteraceae bacterium GWC2_58_44]